MPSLERARLGRNNNVDCASRQGMGKGLICAMMNYLMEGDYKAIAPFLDYGIIGIE